MRDEELGLDLPRRHRLAEEIALPFLASHADQLVGDGAALDALGDDGQTKLPGKPNRRTDDRGVVVVGEQVEHERPVDLETVERKLLQIREARIAGAEIVEHDANAEIPDPPKDVEHP